MKMDEIMQLYQNTHEGFSEEEISKAEQRIGVRLPENYRNYLKQFGLDKINQIHHSLNVPKDIYTSYQMIEWTLEDWKEEFEEAVSKGNQEEYSDHEYFTLWQLPVEEWHKITDNYVLVWTENQGVWNAGYLLSDLQAGNPDPPVYISTNDDEITFEKCTNTMKAFLKEVFSQAQEGFSIEEFRKELENN